MFIGRSFVTLMLLFKISRAIHLSQLGFMASCLAIKQTKLGQILLLIFSYGIFGKSFEVEKSGSHSFLVDPYCCTL